VTDDIEKIRAIATPLLAAAPTAGAAGVAAFAPRPEDYARVFNATIAPAMELHFSALWARTPEITAHAEQTELQLWSARADQLGGESPGFPGGYKALAPHLVPDRIWSAWKYVRPGTTLGMAYDGLVWLDDRFVWFPKPWRALKDGKSTAGIYVD